MHREKFPERKFQLRTEDVRDRIIALVRNLPLDAEHPIETVFREFVEKRNLAQNAYYWLRLGEIADQGYFDGKRYAADVWHEYCRRNIMPNEITVKDGTVRSKFIEVPRGEPGIISTTELEKKCFADYCTAIEAFGASIGVMFSANPRDYQMQYRKPTGSYTIVCSQCLE